MDQKLARICLFAIIALSVIGVTASTTIAFISIADGKHAGRVAAESHWGGHAPSRLERSEPDQLNLASIVADWGATAMLIAVDRAAQREVPSVKLAETLGPWPAVTAMLATILALIAFGPSAYPVKQER